MKDVMFYKNTFLNRLKDFCYSVYQIPKVEPLVEVKPTLTLIRGVPGSGKSSLAKELAYARNADHFEADQYFTDDYGVYRYDRNKLPYAHEWCIERTYDSLIRGRDVIVSNTFTTQRELNAYFKISMELGIFPSVIYCQNDYGSIHSVPDESMVKMKTRFAHSLFEFMKDKKELFIKMENNETESP